MNIAMKCDRGHKIDVPEDYEDNLCPVCDRNGELTELNRIQPNPEGHLSRWMADQCDMENEGDRLAMEQYRSVIDHLHRLTEFAENWFQGANSLQLSNTDIRFAKAALKATEEE